MSTPRYTLTGVRHGYNGRTVLTIDTFSIQPGEILAIVGPSGAGKTTLLRLLNFLEAPDAGSIQYDDQPVPHPAPLLLRRRVTTVLQQPQLLNRSVTANLVFGQRLRGIRPDSATVSAMLDRLGLAHVAHQRALSLSVGEAQRLALGRALLIRPDVLLLDEPTANLDPYNVGLLEALVTAENQRHGTTVVLVTHNTFQARRVAHRCALLLGGRVIEDAPTTAFFDAPRHPQTAAFLRGELVY